MAIQRMLDREALYSSTAGSAGTHAFDNHMHCAGVPGLERGSNHWETAPLNLASRCGSVGLLFRPGSVQWRRVP